MQSGALDYNLNPEGFRAYGAAAELWESRHPEVMLSGPYETGKTFATMHKFHLLLSKYPNSRGLIVKKSYKSLVQTALVTFEEKILPVPPRHPASLITVYGGSKPEWYQYPNGSKAVCGGMDNADKVLSGEYDFIYVNQAEELELDDWEKLTTRCTGRAGNSPYTQIIGDCNPSHDQHWILKRERLKKFYSSHKDNPTLYDPETGDITKKGQDTMDTLEQLTGLRRARGLEGKWVAAEGQVYEFFAKAHIVPNFTIPDDWPRFRAIDFGYKHPFVCLWIALSPEKDMYVYREIYMTGRTVAQHSQQIKDLSKDERILYTVADHDAEDNATLHENGISTRLADKRIRPGIEAVEARLAASKAYHEYQQLKKVRPETQENPAAKKPKLYFLEDTLAEFDQKLDEKGHPTRTVQEFGRYVYRSELKGLVKDEHPLKEYDDGMDAIRYAVMSQEASLYNFLLQTPMVYSSAKVRTARPRW